MAPGRYVGRYLLNLGHRRIAYVSVHHDSMYSQNRLTGLEQEFDSAGVRYGVVPLTCANPGLHPWNPRTDAPVEIEGFINERESTGRAG